MIFETPGGVRDEKESDSRQNLDKLVALSEVWVNKGGLDKVLCEVTGFDCQTL